MKIPWLDNACEYEATGNAGRCPKCGSEEIEVLLHSSDNHRSISLRCKKCGSGNHFDGTACGRKS